MNPLSRRAVLRSTVATLALASGCSALPLSGPSWRLKLYNYSDSAVSVSFNMTDESEGFVLSDTIDLESGRQNVNVETYTEIPLGEPLTIEVEASGSSIKDMHQSDSVTIGDDQRLVVGIWDDHISIKKRIP